MASTPMMPTRAAADAPVVRLEMRHGSTRPSFHEVTGEEFLIGSVPGCDLRIPGSNLPPIICQIVRRGDGLRVRKLAPTQPVLLNGQPVVTQAALAHGDNIQIGPVDLQVHLALPEPSSQPLALPPRATLAPPTAGVAFVPFPPKSNYSPPPGLQPVAAQPEMLHQFQAEMQQFREQVARFEERRRLIEADEARRRETLEAKQQELNSQSRLLETQSHQLETLSAKLDERTRELESDRVLWYRRREEIERECQEQTDRASALAKQLHDREAELTQKSAETQRQEQLLEFQRGELERVQADRDQREQQLERERREVAALRQELTRIQQEFASKVQSSRDQITSQDQALRSESLRLQQDRLDLDAQVREFTERVQQFAPRLRELDAREQAVVGMEADAARIAQTLAERQAWQEAQLQERLQQIAQHEADLQAREAQMAANQQALQEFQDRYHGDLVRIDRSHADLDLRQRELDVRAQEIEQRYAQMQRDAGDLEEQARKVDSSHEQVREETERLALQKSEQERVASNLAERSAALEGQQATLSALRTRLERMREELRQQAQQLAAEREKQEGLANQLKDRLLTADKLKTELDEENLGREQERAEMEKRAATMQAAIAQLRQHQEKLEADTKHLQARAEQLNSQQAEQTEQAGVLRARAQQLVELQQRLEADRQSLRERESAIAQAEEARKSLQEQLRRRGDELAARTKAVEDQARGITGKESELAQAREQAEQERKKAEEQFESLKRDLETRAAEIQRLNAALTQREDNLRRQVERLKEAGQAIATDRKSLFEAKARWESEQSAVVDQLTHARGELDSFRSDTMRNAAELARFMPELELRSQGAIDRLSQSREQLRGHLAELHSYARQSQEDLQELRTQVQAESDRLRQQELALHRARSEHRLSVTAFRQQLIDWQGRVADMKNLFTQSESRLELKQQEVEQAAREVDAGAKELAKRVETLDQQQREVSDRRTEVNEHLGDMREWYRKKMRELAGGASRNYSGEVLELPKANGVNDPEPPKAEKPATAPPGERDILTITGDVDPADRKLGDRLLSLGLVDQDLLIPLWAEARRQRRSLRQVLLTSGTITLYQMALIEAGNVDGLMLGAFRVIDRVQSTPRETLYRVFDPKRTAMALLRHLAESEMGDAIHPDEYRQRFAAAAAIPHPNLAATFEVLEINDRPAALQEWVSGLASQDWPALAAVPGAWYRLLGQTALGLHAAHQGGLTHGRLEAHSVVLTADGTVKVSGIGEPAWLTGGHDPADGVTADLVALGKLATNWSVLVPRRKTSKPKPFPEALQNVVRRLGGRAFNGMDANDQPILLPPFSEADRYASMAALLEDLELAGEEIPPNAEAWDRLVKHVGENATEGAALRRTA